MNSFEENSGWISAEERLPTKEECEKNDGAFLVQSCTGEMFVGKIFNEYVSVANDYENHLKCCNTYIVAWRPLPEPYRAELKKMAMTNHEAAEKIMKDICTSKFCNDSCMYGDNICPYDMAKKALEEIQQYREIGTVEECRDAVGKQKAKQIIKMRKGVYCCPKCYTVYDDCIFGYDYCINCGQAINDNLEETE